MTETTMLFTFSVVPSFRHSAKRSETVFTGLKGKRVLVTGSTSGIGQAIALRFIQEGARVAVNYYRNLESADETDDLIHRELGLPEIDAYLSGEEHHDSHMLVKADVSKADEVMAMYSQIIESWGGVDILINNAGIQIANNSEDVTVAEFDKVLSVNLRGAFLCAREAVQHFLKEDKEGVIINISSVHQIIPKPRFLGYSVSKGGMQNLTRTLALEYAGKKIRVNGVAPGATITPINSAWVDDPEKKAEVEKHIPMARAGTSEEMAAITAFLCCDEAAYITGQTLYVDGGLTLYPAFRTSWSSE